MARHCASLIVLLCIASSAFAWSNKEHIQLTRIAAQRLIANPDTPPAMKKWLTRAIAGGPQTLEEEKDYLLHKRIGIIPRAIDGLPLWATMPDALALIDRAQKPIEPFGVALERLHYLDLEWFMNDEFARTYAPDLSHKPPLTNFSKDISDPRYKRAGMLPFAVEHSYQELLRCFRANRLEDEPGKFPRDDHATKWAGFLAHYIQDNTQPHHATEDYQSHSYFPKIKDPKKSPNIHADLEYRMLDDEFNDYQDLREEFAALFIEALETTKDPATSPDPWTSTIQIALFSYDALPLIGQAAQAAYPKATNEAPGPWNAQVFFHFKATCFGGEMTLLEMKAHQTALAVKRTESLLLRAWTEAQKP